MMDEHHYTSDHLPLHLQFIVHGLDKIIENLQSSPDGKGALSTLVRVIEKTCPSQTRNVFLGPPDNPVGKEVNLKRFLQKFEPLLRVTWTKAELKQDSGETAQEVVERFFHSAVAECASILYYSGSYDGHDLHATITSSDNPVFITLGCNFQEFMASLHSQKSIFNIASDIFLCESGLVQNDEMHSSKEPASESIHFYEDEKDHFDSSEIGINKAISELKDHHFITDDQDSVLPGPPAPLFTGEMASSLSLSGSNSPVISIQHSSLQDQSSLKVSTLPLDGHSGNPQTRGDDGGVKSSDAPAIPTVFTKEGTFSLPSSGNDSTGSGVGTAPAHGCSPLEDTSLTLYNVAGRSQDIGGEYGAVASCIQSASGGKEEIGSPWTWESRLVSLVKDCQTDSSLQDQSSLKVSTLPLDGHSGNAQTQGDGRGAKSSVAPAIPTVFTKEGTFSLPSSGSGSTGSGVGTAPAHGCSPVEDTSLTLYNVAGRSQDIGGEYGAVASCIQSASGGKEEIGSPWTWESRLVSLVKDRQTDLTERATAMRHGVPSKCAVTIVKETGFFEMLLMEKLSGYMHPIIGISSSKGWLLVHFWEGESYAVDLGALSPGTKQDLAGPGAKVAGGTPDNIHKWAIIHSMGRVLRDNSILKVVYDTVDLSNTLEENAGLKIVRVFDVLEADRIIRGHNVPISLAELLHIYGMVPYSSVDIVTGSQRTPVSEDIMDYCGKSQQEAISNLREMAQISSRMIPFLYQSMLSVMSAPMLAELNQRSNATVQSPHHSDYWYNPSEGTVISEPVKVTPHPTSYTDALVGMDKMEIATLQRTPCFIQGTGSGSKETECERTEMQKQKVTSKKQQSEHQGETQEQKQQGEPVREKKKRKKKKKNSGKPTCPTYADAVVGMVKTEIATLQQTPCFVQGTGSGSKETECERTQMQKQKVTSKKQQSEHQGETQEQKQQGEPVSEKKKRKIKMTNAGEKSLFPLTHDSQSFFDALDKQFEESLKKKREERKWLKLYIAQVALKGPTGNGSGAYGSAKTKNQTRSCKTESQNDVKVKKSSLSGSSSPSNIKPKKSSVSGASVPSKTQSNPSVSPLNLGVAATKVQLKVQIDCKPKKGSITRATSQVKPIDPQSKQEKHQPAQQQNYKVTDSVEAESKKKKKKSKSPQELSDNAAQEQTKAAARVQQLKVQIDCKLKKASILTSTTGQVKSEDPHSKQEKHQPAQQQNYEVNDSVEAESKKKKKKTKSPQELIVQNALKRLTGNESPAKTKDQTSSCKTESRNDVKVKKSSISGSSSHSNIKPKKASITSATGQVKSKDPQSKQEKHQPAQQQNYEVNDSVEAESNKKKKQKKSPEEISDDPALIPEKEHTETEVSCYQQQPKKKKNKKNSPEDVSDDPALIPEKEHTLHKECPAKEHDLVPNPSVIDCRPKTGSITGATGPIKSPTDHLSPGVANQKEQNQMPQPKVQNDIKPKDSSVSGASGQSKTQTNPPVIPPNPGVGATQNLNQVPQLKLQVDSKPKKSSITVATGPIKSKDPQSKQEKQQPKQQQKSKGKDSTEAESKKKKKKKRKRSKVTESKEAEAIKKQKKKKSQIPQHWEEQLKGQIKMFPETKMSTSPLWLKPMVLQFQKDNNPVFIHPLTEQASIPINPCKITDELDEQFDDLLMSDVITFVEAFPGNLQLALQQLSEESFSYSYIHLAEVVMDVGRKPKARYLKSGFNSELTEKVLNHDELTKQELKEILRDNSIVRTSDNQAMIRDMLHRIGLLANGQGEVIGMTAKVEHPLPGCLSPLYDVFNKGQSILVVGPTGVGKTTLLREAARVLSDLERKNVFVIDTFLEIAGEGDIPHQSIGSARRLQVEECHLQHKMMKESYQNHRPEIVIIDEISSLEDSKMALNMRLRGIQLIAGVNGQNLADVLNAALAPITGSIKESCIVGQEGGKLVRMRTGPPVFDVLVEMVEREQWLIHWDFARAIDHLLPGGSRTVEVEERLVKLDEDDEGMVTRQVLAMQMPASYNYTQ